MAVVSGAIVVSGVAVVSEGIGAVGVVVGVDVASAVGGTVDVGTGVVVSTAEGAPEDWICDVHPAAPMLIVRAAKVTNEVRGPPANGHHVTRTVCPRTLRAIGHPQPGNLTGRVSC